MNTIIIECLACNYSFSGSRGMRYDEQGDRLQLEIVQCKQCLAVSQSYVVEASGTFQCEACGSPAKPLTPAGLHECKCPACGDQELFTDEDEWAFTE